MAKYANMRQGYQDRPLRQKDITERWDEQLSLWVAEATEAGLSEPNAMILATSAGNIPATRTVLMKDLSPQGISFFTNLQSRKARQMKTNPNAAICFSWPSLQRQITLRGTVEQLDDQIAEAYFRERPRESQLGAVASRQSQRVDSREELQEALRKAEAEHPEEIARPEDWGGYLFKPWEVEFWQGGPGRMHDRIRLREVCPGQWQKERLSP